MFKFIIISIFLISGITANDSIISEIAKINNRIDNIERTHTHDSIASLQMMLMNFMIESRWSIQNLTLSIDRKFESVEKRFESIDRKFESIDRKFESIEKRSETSELRNEVRFNHLESKFDNLALEFKNISFWQTYFTTPTWLLLTMSFPLILKYIINTEFFKFLIHKIFPEYNYVVNYK
jgi:hypothetical protein